MIHVESLLPVHRTEHAEILAWRAAVGRRTPSAARRRTRPDGLPAQVGLRVRAAVRALVAGPVAASARTTGTPSAVCGSGVPCPA